MDPYQTLGIPRDADSDAIKAAYRRCAQNTHPDRKEGSDAEFVAVKQAYEVLSDPERRAHYDKTGSIGDPSGDMKQALFGIEAMLMQIIDSVPDVESLDIVETMKKIVRLRIASLARDTEAARARILKKQKAARRLKRKGQAPNLMAKILERSIAAEELKIAGFEKDREFAELTLKVVDEYEYETAIFVPSEFRSYFGDRAAA